MWDESLCSHCEACITSCNHGANSFEDGKYTVFYHQCTTCQHCVKVCPTGAITLDAHNYTDFQTGMALCTRAVLDTFSPGSVFYINFLTNITAICDCWGISTPAVVPDIGIMAGTDIVAVERASLDAIKAENLLPAGVSQGSAARRYRPSVRAYPRQEPVHSAGRTCQFRPWHGRSTKPKKCGESYEKADGTTVRFFAAFNCWPIPYGAPDTNVHS